MKGVWKPRTEQLLRSKSYQYIFQVIKLSCQNYVEKTHSNRKDKAIESLVQMNNRVAGPKLKLILLCICWILSASVAIWCWSVPWPILFRLDQSAYEFYLIYLQWIALILNAIFSWHKLLIGVSGLMLFVILRMHSRYQNDADYFTFEHGVAGFFLIGTIVLTLWIRASIEWRWTPKLFQKRTDQ